MMTKNYNNIAFLLRGKYRKQILELLRKPNTPTMIKNKLQLHFNICSRCILELEKKGFVKCLNSCDKLMRFYQTTNEGKKLLSSVK